jgi:hypothetical protein
VCVTGSGSSSVADFVISIIETLCFTIRGLVKNGNRSLGRPITLMSMNLRETLCEDGMWI